MSEHSTSDGVMHSDQSVSPFADALRKEEKGFEKAHKKEAGVTQVPSKASSKRKKNAHNVFANGVSGKNGQWTWDGLPFKGRPGDFKHDDPDYMKPQLKHAAKVEQFNLNDEEHMKRYNEVIQKAWDGLVLISFEEKIYDQSIESWRILLRYAEPFYTSPPSMQE